MTSQTSAPDEPLATLQRYLARDREALLWKLDGISERDARLPRTPTGLSLAGIVKHCANVEIGYFGLTFGRDWPTPDDACFVPLTAYDDDPQADWYLTEPESVADLRDFYARVQTFADATIADLGLDAVGAPPWWGDPAENQVTLHHMLVRVVDDLARHAGQADVVRELIDGQIGLNPAFPNIPEAGYDWSAYCAKLTRIAEATATS